MKRWLRWTLTGLTGMYGMFLWGAQVSPEDAFNNLSKWFALIGLNEIPEWLYWIVSVPYARVLGTVAILVSISLIVYPRIIHWWKGGHFDWINQWIREIWTGVLILLSLYLLWTQPVLDLTMFFHKQQTIPQVLIYVIFAVVGAGLFSGYYWFTGRRFDSSPSTNVTKTVPELGPKEQIDVIPKSDNFRIRINRVSKFEPNRENPRRYRDVYLDVEVVNRGPLQSAIYGWQAIVKVNNRQASARISDDKEERPNENLKNYSDVMIVGDRKQGWIKIVVFGPDVQPNITLGVSFQDVSEHRYSDEIKIIDPDKAWIRPQ